VIEFLFPFLFTHLLGLIFSFFFFFYVYYELSQKASTQQRLHLLWYFHHQNK
jgi:hypothetical protein